MIIYVIVDFSGSMKEMGKSFLLRNLIRYIAELAIIYPKKFSQIKFNFLKLNNTLSELDIHDNEDILPFETTGTADLRLLEGFLAKELKSSSKVKSVLLSDGGFSKDSVDLFCHWSKDQINLVINAVAIGTDANDSVLGKLSNNGKTYTAENISTAINSLLFDIDSPLSCPASINDFGSLVAPELEEDWGE